MLVTMTKGGRVLDASPQAAEHLRREGWVAVTAAPVARAAPLPVAIEAPKKRKSKK